MLSTWARASSMQSWAKSSASVRRRIKARAWRRKSGRQRARSTLLVRDAEEQTPDGLAVPSTSPGRTEFMVDSPTSYAASVASPFATISLEPDLCRCSPFRRHPLCYKGGNLIADLCCFVDELD